MLIRLSSKGRLVIPKALRESLRLQNNNLFRVQVKDGKIILEPLSKEVVNRLRGKNAGHNLLNALEDEHRQEK
jgi:AbrB family looped-hinge helix DNA binding protein